VEPNADPNPVFCPVLILPKPVPAVWFVLLVPKSGVGAAAIKIKFYTLFHISLFKNLLEIFFYFINKMVNSKQIIITI